MMKPTQTNPSIAYAWVNAESVSQSRCTELATEVFRAASDVVGDALPLNATYSIAYSPNNEAFEIYRSEDFNADRFTAAEIESVLLLENDEDFLIASPGDHSALSVALMLVFSEEPDVELEVVTSGFPSNALMVGYRIAKRLRPELVRPSWVPRELSDEPVGPIERPDHLDFRA